jgi:hypothetical protein
MISFRTVTLLILTYVVQVARCGITLNKLYPDWDFTVKNLVNTTSEACKAAFSAELECDETLLGLAASMRSVFKPTAADFDRTCTPECSASVDSYIGKLMSACGAPGDLAETASGTTNTLEPRPPVQVWVVGWVLQYTLTRSCDKDGYGSN